MLHPKRIRRIHLLPALCALLSGCAGFAPGWDSRPPSVPVSTPAVVATAPVVLTREDMCHAQAWQHRLDILGDQGLAYGQAYRDCMQRLALGDAVVPAAGSAPSQPVRASQQGTHPGKPARN